MCSSDLIEGIKVRVTAKAPTPDEANAMLDAEEQVLRDLLGELIFGLDDETMESVVLDLCRRAGLTLAVAESVTGGLIASRISALPGASDVFRGGVVAYDPAVKHEVLGVPDGPVVTEETAAAMARGAQRVLGADAAIATSGVAGPSELEQVPVGTVCLAVAVGDEVVTTTVRLPGDRARVGQFATISAVDLLRRTLLARG